MIKDYIKEISVGNVKLKNNVFLGPMAGITDIPFRKICKKFNPGLMFTEMASSKAMEYNSKKTERLLEVMEDERPSAVQIFGSNKDVITNTILKLNEIQNIDIININMGCPAPKIVKNGDGAGLLLDLKNVEEIIKEAKRVSKKPISIKTRKGYYNDKITVIDVAKICEYYGVEQLIIHGRTREEYYSNKADLDIIRKVKDLVKIQVIGNGDIVDIDSAEKMFKITNCDGIMIARAALGNPWIFKSILDGKLYTPTNEEKYNTIIEHINNALEYEKENPKQALLKMRKHIAWYLKGMYGGTKVKDRINREEDIDEVKKILYDFF